MNEQDIIKVVPIEVKKVLEYIQQLILNKNYNSTLEFFPAIVDNEDICILKINKNNGCEQVPIKILSQYDYLFYQQLLISILDIYLDRFGANISGIYPGSVNFDYYFFLFNSIVKISATHDLEKLVDYCNDRVKTHKNKMKGVFKK